MTYDLRLREEPFDFSYELDNYNIGLFEPELELEPEFDELQTQFADFEGEEEISRGPRGASPVSRGRPPLRHPRPPRTIIRPWRASGGVIHEPLTCICPELTCPQHGSECIRWVQSTLNRILGMKLPLNGVLTPATRSAVRSFQEREKLPVTGIVGPDTERAFIARSGQSPGAGATKPDEPRMTEPHEPAATPPEPGMTEPAEPAAASSAAECEFEWEVGPTKAPNLPLILAGPIVRRATTDAVWFWFACSKEVKGCQARITPYDPKGNIWLHLVDPHLKEITLRLGDLHVVRLGENIWVVLVSAVPKSGKFPTDITLGYDLEIATKDNGEVKWTKLSKLDLEINYAPFPRPTFVIGELNRKLVHGSCRRPGAVTEDAFVVYDQWLATRASDAFARPASLILTGDQIYADDVAVPLFEAVRRIALHVFGYVERIPNPNGKDLASVDSLSWGNTPSTPVAGAGKWLPYWSSRKNLTHRITSPIGFTTDDGEAHLLSFPEYAAMYLTVWNPELCIAYGIERSSEKTLKEFCRATQACRRVMANTATYMLCDDHEITDDWNLDQEWEDSTKKSPLARRIIANGLAAYWGFQAWGNDPDMFDKKFVQALSVYFDQLRSSKGYPRNVGSRSPYNAVAKYEELLLNTHWSFMAASNPKALCVDTRTRRETPKGKTAILSGKRAWPYLTVLLRKHHFRKGDTLLLVTPTPFLPHRSMMYIQNKEYSFPKERYKGDFELYGNNPQQRAELVFWLQHHFGPSALIFFSGDVHHGSVVTGRYGYGATLEKIESGNADWVMRIVQITSSPIKNEKDVAYRKKRWWTAWQTDAGNVGESIIRQWERQYARTTENTYIAMQAAIRKLSGNLGRETYIFEPHLCAVDMPTRPKGYVKVLFVGVKSGKLQTATVTVDTDNDPVKFKISKVGGLVLPPQPELLTSQAYGKEAQSRMALT